MKSKIKCISIIGFIGLSAIAIREVYCMVMYLYNISIRRGDKTFLTKLIDVKDESEVLLEDFSEEGDKVRQWAEKTESYEILINSFDKTQLFGKIYKNKNHNWVIILHGFGGVGDMMNYAGEEFYNQGFNVLIPDMRGHGKSGGDYIGMGWEDRLDVIKWCEEIEKRDKIANIVIYGVSMGGATAMMLSGENLNKSIKCIIEDCGYSSIFDIFKCQMKKLGVPAFPLIYLTGMVCRFKNGFSFFDGSSIKAVEKSTIPMLFLHGSNDKFVPMNMCKKAYKSKKNGDKEIYIFKGAGHGVSAFIGKEKYWGKIWNFIGKYIY